MAALLLLLLSVLSICHCNPLVVDKNATLHYYLCTEEGQMKLSKPGTILELTENKQFSINPSSKSCVVSNFINLTIKSTGSKGTIIACNRSSVPHEFTITSGCGLAFLNGTDLNLEKLTFVLFGAVLDDNTIAMDNATELPSYFGTNQTASVIISNVLNLNASTVKIAQYYGYAMIIINCFGNSSLSGVTVEGSLSQTVCPLILDNLSHYNYTCTGSGTLIYYHDPIGGDNDMSIVQNVFLELKNSMFINNDYFDPHSLCITNIFQFQPERVPVVAGAGVTLYATQTRFKVFVTLDGLIVTKNNGAISGGLATIFMNTPFRTFVTITNSILQNNNNSYFTCFGESLLMYAYFTDSFLNGDNARSIGLENYMKTWNPLLVTNTSIIDNAGYNRSSSVYNGIRSQSLYEIKNVYDNVLFMNNQAFYTGICMFVETIYEPMQSTIKLIRIDLNNINATLNSQILNKTGNLLRSNSSQFVFYRVGRVTIKGEHPQISSFVHNIGSVIDAFSSEIYLKGWIEFKHNRATMGAAILLRSNSFLVFGENSTVVFEDNHAYENGGAVYSVERGTEDNYCVMQIDSNRRNFIESNIAVSIRNNRARGSGAFAYVTPLFHCFQSRFHVFPRHLSSLYGKLFNLSTDKLDSELSTVPTSVCFCILVNGTYQPACGKELAPFDIYPGDKIHIHLVAYDDVDNKVTSQVNASLSEINSSAIPLKGWHIQNSEINSRIVDEGCSHLTYEIYSNNLTCSNGQLNFAVPDHQPQISVSIQLKKCPLGFPLNNKSGECVCDDFFASKGLSCNTSTKSIHRGSLYDWIGAVNVNNTMTIGYAKNCPIGYCNSSTMEINMAADPFVPVNICVNNKAGQLCGNCIEGYSAVHGGIECRKCTDSHLWFLLLNISSGFLAVLVLFLLKSTINYGTIVGIVFYANIFDIISISNEKKVYLLPFLQVIEILNLHQAFPMCLFDGMEYAYTFIIEYVYSVYVWMIVLAIIIMSRCSRRLSHLLMTSSVQVLVSLVHLSFAKVLSAVIKTFTYTVVYYEGKSYTAWLYNGTIHYGTGKSVSYSTCTCVPYMYEQIIMK